MPPLRRAAAPVRCERAEGRMQHAHREGVGRDFNPVCIVDGYRQVGTVTVSRDPVWTSQADTVSEATQEERVR